MRRAAFALAAIFLVTVAGGCAEETPPARTLSAEARGAVAFDDPRISSYSFNPFACRTCHDSGAERRRVPGAPLGGVTRRTRFWGGAEADLLSSINACMRFFLGDANGLTRSDDRAISLYAYLDGLPGDGGAVPFTVVASITDLPRGDAARGEGVWTAACAPCHGSAHTGAGRLPNVNVRVPESTIEEHAPKGDDVRLIVIEKVRHGAFLGYSGRMPPFSLEVLGDADLADVLSYLGLDP